MVNLRPVNKTSRGMTRKRIVELHDDLESVLHSMKSAIEHYSNHSPRSDEYAEQLIIAAQFRLQFVYLTMRRIKLENEKAQAVQTERHT